MSAPCGCRVTVGDANDDQVLGFDTAILYCDRHSEVHVMQMEVMLSAATVRAMGAEAKLEAITKERDQARAAMALALGTSHPEFYKSSKEIALEEKIENLTKERDALQAIANEAALTVARLVERLERK